MYNRLNFAKKRQAAVEVRPILQALFPAVFVADKDRKKPLGRGIHRDVKAALPELPMWKIAAAIGDYTSGPRYLRVMKAGADRVRLDGQPDGVVTEEDALHASIKLHSTLLRIEKERAKKPPAAPPSLREAMDDLRETHAG